MNLLAFVGPWEWIIIAGVVMLLFGAKKLPELARSMGSSVTQFKKGLKEGGADESREPAGRLAEPKPDELPRDVS